MRIQKLTISNFCSIEKAEIEPSMFAIFVGQNNHGKTNVFESLKWFYNGKDDIQRLRHGRTGDAEVSVEIEFSGVQGALASMRNDKNRSSLAKILGNDDTIRVKRSSQDPKSRKIFDPTQNDWLDKNPTGFDTAFNDLLPVFEYVDTSTHLTDVAKYSKTSPIGAMLAGVLMALLENSKPYQDFRAKFDDLFTAPESDVRVELDKLGAQVTLYIGKQFPDCMQVIFKIIEPAFEELLRGCTTDVDDGILTNASEKGDGMQRALMLAILQTYADFRRNGEASGKRFLFLIDEAELHLHPSAQRHLKAALRDIADAGDQVLINTHSSVLVAEDAAGQSIFRVEKSNKKSSVTAIDGPAKPGVIYELLGGSPSDLLLPRNFLIVEGRSDQLFLEGIIRRFFPDMPAVQIIFAEGDFEKQRTSMDAINALFAPLSKTSMFRDRLVILCDAPNPKKLLDFEHFKRCYPYLESQGQLQILPTQSLEEYYPDPFKKTAAEVAALGKTLGIKRDLAITVAKSITLKQIENDMPAILTALQRCWGQAFA